MRAFWFDPYLWVHAAGAAVVPLGLLLCLLGFAVGDPSLPGWVELGIVSAIGILPIFWMQTQKPFYIYAIIALSLPPERLDASQRQILALFQSRKNVTWITVAAIVLFFILKQLYTIAPIASDVTPLPEARWIGLTVAAIGFFLSNLFLQVPLSVLSVMLTSEAEAAATPPIALEQIRQRFTIIGVPVNQILPPITVPSSNL